MDRRQAPLHGAEVAEGLQTLDEVQLHELAKVRRLRLVDNLHVSGFQNQKNVRKVQNPDF